MVRPIELALSAYHAREISRGRGRGVRAGAIGPVTAVTGVSSPRTSTASRAAMVLSSPRRAGSAAGVRSRHPKTEWVTARARRAKPPRSQWHRPIAADGSDHRSGFHG
jgi:hypothetical protein